LARPGYFRWFRGRRDRARRDTLWRRRCGCGRSGSGRSRSTSGWRAGGWWFCSRRYRRNRRPGLFRSWCSGFWWRWRRRTSWRRRARGLRGRCWCWRLPCRCDVRRSSGPTRSGGWAGRGRRRGGRRGRFLGALAGRLLPEQLRQDFLGRSGESHLALVERHQVIARGEQDRAVGDDDHRAVFAQLDQGLAQALFGLAVEAGRRLVQ